MYLIKTPNFIKGIFPNYQWNVPNQDKVIYLTFDDGPIPEVTPWVVDLLAEYEAKATFFCVGDNVRKHPDVFNYVLNAGHEVGNHTMNHLNGWTTENIEFFHNIRHCARLVNSELFRPPYGKLTPKQGQFIQRHYEIVMWDILSGDFDRKLSSEQVWQNVKRNIEPGSIVVFHDSIKAQKHLRYALPKTLAYFSSKGYRFEAISKALIDNLKEGAQSVAV